MPVFAAQSTGSSDPFESVSNFFDSGLWSFISLTLRVFVVVMWLALVWWTYQDARRRTDNPALIAGAVALAVFLPFLGALVYLTIRPPESLPRRRFRRRRARCPAGQTRATSSSSSSDPRAGPSWRRSQAAISPAFSW